MQSEFGLLSKLLSSRVLTVTDQQANEAENTAIGRNQKLLDIIFERGKYHEVIDALQNSGQTHVVNWINGNRDNDLIALISNCVIFINDSVEFRDFEEQNRRREMDEKLMREDREKEREERRITKEERRKEADEKRRRAEDKLWENK